ncbi:MAG: hypothetical protein STSR0009_20460 [Methanoregula sp.]
MRYYLDPSTLFVRGAFRAACIDTADEIRTVTTLLLHTVPRDFGAVRRQRELARVVAEAGIGGAYAGLLTTVPVQHLCVLQYDHLTVFLVAGMDDNPAHAPCTTGIIVFSREGMEDTALKELLRVAGEARSLALKAAGYSTPGTSPDGVIVACEGAVTSGNGRSAEDAERVREAIKKGVPEALRRSHAGGIVGVPGFFIFSRFKGEHWVEWTPDDCPYYPCHFAGQRCDFCYCPFYPCHNEDLGEWANGSNGGRVWNCARCTLLHEPRVADYLNKYPESSLKELMHLSQRK